MPEDAGNVVSRAVHEAQAEGLKGQELAKEAHQAIAERKEAHTLEVEKKKIGKKVFKKKITRGAKIQPKGKGKR